MDVVAVDIGGTHARFAIAEVEDGRMTALHAPVKMKTAEHASLQMAWEAFAREAGRPLPPRAGIAVACPIIGETLKLTNNPWVIKPGQFHDRLGLESFTLVNDFGAIGHAVAQAAPEDLQHLCGPDAPLPEDGVITVLGPGTGLGVTHVLRRRGRYHVIECEGGHIDFAPLDSVEDAILTRLRERYRRVSIERIVSGPGLRNIYEALGALEGQCIQAGDDVALWTAALEGRDSLASAALERFCMSLGSVAGDLALAHGACGVVIAGGVGQRLAEILPNSGFAQRFTAKGRFESMMARLPVKLITHPHPGLFGAAAAFAEEHCL
ncbi:glucokinase [Pedomonas mirosovicensis]|uniref:glucokinase n=1 Tax=Pedomonas mirosovicensis TaxID=2908641 RepID=UPI002169259B|nr:glucokinase [Pedomonas mirosovicensis]MCH8686219.1 glucokinase [Pedomonas mirosovicensis]